VRAKDREFLNAECGERLESMLRRIGQVKAVVPWLRPGMSYSALRRTAARLRAGVIRPDDPRVSPILLAEMIERAIEQELLVKLIVQESREYGEIYRSFVEKDEAERARRYVASFHRLKKSPEARDPETPVAQRVRRIHRARRNALGRPRKPRGRVAAMKRRSRHFRAFIRALAKK
jgi:hypothetical protein